MTKLVFFDCDGVLTIDSSSWLILHNYFKSQDNSYFAKLYDEDKISYLDWMKIDVALMINSWRKPIYRKDVEKALDKIRIKDEVYYIGKILKQRGYLLGVISSGVEYIVKKVCNILGADICLYNELIYDEKDRLIPGGKPWVPLKEKPALIEAIARSLGLDMSNVVYVGDSRWDIPVFKKVGLSIAVEPCNEACKHADIVINNLSEIIDVLK